MNLANPDLKSRLKFIKKSLGFAGVDLTECLSKQDLDQKLMHLFKEINVVILERCQFMCENNSSCSLPTIL